VTPKSSAVRSARKERTDMPLGRPMTPNIRGSHIKQPNSVVRQYAEESERKLPEEFKSKPKIPRTPMLNPTNINNNFNWNEQEQQSSEGKNVNPY
jgi:hypothetical protein